MNQLLLHIGLHKTATTYLQNEYFNKLQDTTYFRYSAPNMYSRLGKEAYSRTILISNEGISGTAWDHNQIHGKKSTFNWIDSYKTSIQNLKRLHPTAIPIIFLRKHGDLLISMYKQYVQEGGVLNLNQFYDENGIIKDSDLSYERRIQVLEENFERFYVLSFEKFKTEGDVYLENFFSSLGVEVKDLVKAERKKANVSISGKKVEALRKINRFYNRFPLKGRKIVRLLRLSPRDILQKRMTFWKSRDSDLMLQLKQHINNKHKQDWEKVEKWFWDYEYRNNIEEL